MDNNCPGYEGEIFRKERIRTEDPCVSAFIYEISMN